MEMSDNSDSDIEDYEAIRARNIAERNAFVSIPE